MITILKFLKNKAGSGYLWPAVIVMAVAMFLSVVIFYANTMTTVRIIKDNTQKTLDSFIMNNATLIFDSIKKGSDYTESINQNTFVSAFGEDILLNYEDGLLYSYDTKGNVIFSLTNPEVTYRLDHTLKLKAALELRIPVAFMGKKFFDLRIPIAVNSSYEPKTD